MTEYAVFSDNLRPTQVLRYTVDMKIPFCGDSVPCYFNITSINFYEFSGQYVVSWEYSLNGVDFYNDELSYGKDDNACYVKNGYNFRIVVDDDKNEHETPRFELDGDFVVIPHYSSTDGEVCELVTLFVGFSRDVACGEGTISELNEDGSCVNGGTHGFNHSTTYSRKLDCLVTDSYRNWISRYLFLIFVFCVFTGSVFLVLLVVVLINTCVPEDMKDKTFCRRLRSSLGLLKDSGYYHCGSCFDRGYEKIGDGNICTFCFRNTELCLKRHGSLICCFALPSILCTFLLAGAITVFYVSQNELPTSVVAFFILIVFVILEILLIFLRSCCSLIFGIANFRDESGTFIITTGCFFGCCYFSLYLFTSWYVAILSVCYLNAMLYNSKDYFDQFGEFHCTVVNADSVFTLILLIFAAISKNMFVIFACFYGVSKFHEFSDLICMLLLPKVCYEKLCCLCCPAGDLVKMGKEVGEEGGNLIKGVFQAGVGRKPERVYDGKSDGDYGTYGEVDDEFAGGETSDKYQELLERENSTFPFRLLLVQPPQVELPSNRLCPFCHKLNVRDDEMCKHTTCYYCHLHWCHICLRVPSNYDELLLGENATFKNPQEISNYGNHIHWPCANPFDPCNGTKSFESFGLYPLQTRENKSEWSQKRRYENWVRRMLERNVQVPQGGGSIQESQNGGNINKFQT